MIVQEESFEETVKRHYALYPLMKAQDYIKLAFQRYMGPGHMVRDRESVLQRLLLERGPEETGAHLEPIGNGLVRVYLSGDEKHYTNEEIAEMFYKTASEFVPDKEKLLGALDILTGMAKEGSIGIGAEELLSLAEPYRLAGCPLISHSEQYNKRYAPHYRVVDERYIK